MVISISIKPPGTYDICYWEDDGIQYGDVDYEGGANIPSLRQAQRDYILFGVCEERNVWSLLENLTKRMKKIQNGNRYSLLRHQMYYTIKGND